MKLPMKRLHPAALLPRRATPGSAALDLHACLDETVYLHPGDTFLVPTGFAMALPEGTAGFILPRSGLGHNAGIVLSNLTGVCDGDFRGQVMVAAWNRNRQGMPFAIHPGDRLAQFVILPILQLDPEEVAELDATDRGEGGFGSTGRAAP